jgi:tetratricopeptide (TPR) repeat protein
MTSTSLGDYIASIATTWTISVDRLRREEPRAVDLLKLSAFLAPEPIPRSLLIENHEELPSPLGHAVSGQLRLNRLVEALRRYSLVEAMGEGLHFQSSVQAATRDSMTARERRRWIKVAVTLMRSGFPYTANPRAIWGPSGTLVAHALAVAGHAESAGVDLETVMRLLNEAASFLQSLGEFARAKTAYQRTLEIAEKSLGPQHPDVATYVTNLGYLLSQEGDLAGARECFERALRTGEAVYGPEHPMVVIGASNLAGLLHAQGELSTAKSYLERAINIRKTPATSHELTWTESGGMIAHLPVLEPVLSAAVISQEDQLMLLRTGAPNWNNWRRAHPNVRPNLRSCDLSDADLVGADLSNPDCFKADLRNARLRRSLLQATDFTRANGWCRPPTSRSYRGQPRDDRLASGQYRRGPVCTHLFSNTKLQGAVGLDTCVFSAPSPIDFLTLDMSGPLSTDFLRGCGLPERLIEYLSSLLKEQDNDFYCFISYSSEDDAFVRQMHGDLQELGIRCWFAPADLRARSQAGEAADYAVRSYDIIVLILSRNSISNGWVDTVIGRALAREEVERRTVLFPITLDDSVSRTESTMIIQLRNNHRISDFCDWKDRLVYRRALKKFSQILRTSDPGQG